MNTTRARRAAEVSGAAAIAIALLAAVTLAGCTPSTPEARAAETAKTFLKTEGPLCEDNRGGRWDPRAQDPEIDLERTHVDEERVVYLAIDYLWEGSPAEPRTGWASVRLEGPGAPCIVESDWAEPVTW